MGTREDKRRESRSPNWGIGSYVYVASSSTSAVRLAAVAQQMDDNASARTGLGAGGDYAADPAPDHERDEEGKDHPCSSDGPNEDARADVGDAPGPGPPSSDVNVTIEMPEEENRNGNAAAEARTSGAGDEQQLKQLYGYTKKAIPLELVLLVTISAHNASYAGNTRFPMPMASCLLAFFVDALSAVQLINSMDLALRWHCFLSCVSSVSLILTPYFLLVAYDKLSSYAIIAVLLPVAAALLHRACSRGPTEAAPVDAETLDHVFDLSSSLNNVAAGGGLTGTIFGHAMSSKQHVPAGPLGFTLFFTIFLGIYLMLISTVRPPVLTRHAGTLTYILLLSLAASALVAAIEILGWLACFALVMIIIDVSPTALSAQHVHRGAADTKEVDKSRMKEQKLLSAVVAAVVFMVLMQLHSQSQHMAAAVKDGLRLPETVRMLLYTAAFLWSFSRMLFFHVALAGGPGACRSWASSSIKWVTTVVVMLAVLDLIYNLGIAPFMVMG